MPILQLNFSTTVDQMAIAARGNDIKGLDIFQTTNGFELPRVEELMSQIHKDQPVTVPVHTSSPY
jgi:hypothetical protein